MGQADPGRRALLRAGVAGLAVLVLAGFPAWAATGDGAPSCARRGLATVVSSTEKDDILATLADSWNRDVRHLTDPCVQVVGITSGLAAQRIAASGPDFVFTAADRTTAGEPVPSGSTLDAWTPSATLWPRLLESRGDAAAGRFDTEPRPLARSPLVVVGAPGTVAQVRRRAEAAEPGYGWPDLVSVLHDDRDSLRYTQENARLSTSGAQAALTLSLNLPVRFVEAPEYLRAIQSSSDDVNDSTTIVAGWADRGVEPGAVMLLQAQIAWAFDNGWYGVDPGRPETDRNDSTPGPVPATPLDVFMPTARRGAPYSFVSDHPFLVRTAGPHADAMRRFYRYLRDHAEAFCARGYFDVESTCSPPPIPGRPDISQRFAALTAVRDTGVPTTVDDVLTAWDVLRTPRSLLVLVDVSGSQSPQARRAKAAALAAATDRLRLDPALYGDRADRLTVRAVGRTVRPVVPPKDPTAAGWQAALDAAAKDADTGLSDLRGALCAARSGRSDWVAAGTAPSVVLLSDGVQDTDGSPSPSELDALFRNGSVSGTCAGAGSPAPTYAVRYPLKDGSYGADHDALDRAGRGLMQRLAGEGRYREAALDPAVLVGVFRDILRTAAP